MQKTKVLYYKTESNIYHDKDLYTLLISCEAGRGTPFPVLSAASDCFIVDSEGSANLDHVSDERLIDELAKRGAKQ